MLGVVKVFFGFHEHVVDIGLHCVAQQRSEYLSHQPLISCPSILKLERHHIIAVQPVRCNEGRAWEFDDTQRKRPETTAFRARLQCQQFGLFMARGSYLLGMFR